MGYVFVDDRASGGGVFECDTATCSHCQAIIRIQPRQPQGYWCWKCDKVVCAACGARKVCMPFIKRVEVYWDAMQRRVASDRFARQVGLQEE